jgi:hypothetical protein
MPAGVWNLAGTFFAQGESVRMRSTSLPVHSPNGFLSQKSAARATTAAVSITEITNVFLI